MKNSGHELFYTVPETVKNNTFVLADEEYHHAFKVHRKKIGDPVTAIDGRGNTFTGIIIRRLSGKRVECKIDKTVIKSGEPVTDVSVFMGIIKAARFETFIEKAVEMGVKRIVPLVTERSFKEISSHKLKRWNAIAVSAMKQARRSVLPEISEPVVYEDIMESTEKYHLKLIARHDTDSRHFADISAEMTTGKAAKIAVLIGPEGGFTAEETMEAVNNGFIKVKFGERRLRTETAGIVALATILFTQQDL